MALEVGRKRGSIKKSHHVALVQAIEQAAQQAGQCFSPTQQIEQAKSKTKAVKSDYEQLQESYEILLEKCTSLLIENFELRQKVTT